MIGSKLAGKVIPAYRGNYTMLREGLPIRDITIHHMAARWTSERCGQSFQEVGREGSSHYGIGYDGDIAQYVSEEDTAWTNGDWNSNLTSVTIECANDSVGDPWKVSNSTIDSLVLLIADIAKRNNLGFLKKGINLTWHSMYSATVCPGPYLLSKIDEIIERANEVLSGGNAIEHKPVECTYRAYDGSWLPEVNGHDQNDAVNGYAGNLGNPISGVYVSCSEGNVYYRVHQLGGSWLPEVKNLEDYAGNLGKPIDKIMIRSDVTDIRYQVHTKEGGWLPEVSGYNSRDHLNGYAGNAYETIDALIVRAEPIVVVKEQEKVPIVEEAKEEPPLPQQETPVFEKETEEEDNALGTEPTKKTGNLLLIIIGILERLLAFLKGENK